MTLDEKLNIVKRILGIEDDSEDELLMVYLLTAGQEIISWRFSYSLGQGEGLDVPGDYEMVQVFAVVAGYSQGGAENQTSHSENGISRTFKYEDMIAYIRSHVIPYAKVL